MQLQLCLLQHLKAVTEWVCRITHKLYAKVLVILYYTVVHRGHTLAISDQVSNSATLLPARKGLPERNSIVIMQYNRAKQYTTLTMTLKI